MDDLVRRSEAQELLSCYTEKNNLGHTPYQIVSNLPSAGPKWISVKERLPEDSKVLCVRKSAYPGGRYVDILTYDHGWFLDGEFVVSDRYVTHWMPLPELPKEGGGKNA